MFRRATRGSASKRRKLLRVGVPLALLLGILGVLTGCAWSVKPPPQPQNPSTVYITDYGRHSRLALQVDETHMLEYSFGDWRYYVERERTLWRGVVALTLPTQAGFGRRALPFVDDVEEFNSLAGASRSARLEVEQANVENLLEKLEARYQENIATEVSSDEEGFTFVQDDLSYHLFRNSNHQTANWLRSLDCGVRGIPILSNFQLEDQVRPSE